VHGFTKSDIQLQAGNVDRFVKCQQPQFSAELQSIQLVDDIVASQKTSPDLVDRGLAVIHEPSQSSDIVSKKCDPKASFVKRRCHSNLSRLQHERKHEATESSGMRRFLSLLT